MEIDHNQQFEVTDDVRDNETDLAGVVNHTHYLNYMANARHKHLRILGLDFQEMLAKGYMLVATKVEVRYRLPLFLGDRYCVTSELKNLDTKIFNFKHTVLRLPSREIVATGIVQAACVDCQSNQATKPTDVLKQLAETEPA